MEPDTFSCEAGDTIVATSQIGRFFDGGASNTGFATSDEGGATWTRGAMPGTTTFSTPAGPYDRLSDPSVAYDSEHVVWMISSLGINEVGGGITLPRLILNRSTDGGVTWGKGKRTGNGAGGLGGQPVVQPNGTVIIPANNAFQRQIISFRSTDGGAMWSNTTVVANVQEHFVAGSLRTSLCPPCRSMPRARSPVVWQDCRFRTNCRSNDIVMSTSAAGVNWSGVKRIPIDPLSSKVDHFIPGIAVDPATSGAAAHLGLTCYFYDKHQLRLCPGRPVQAGGGIHRVTVRQRRPNGLRE